MSKKYDEGYIDPTKAPFYMGMKEWKKLMGYDSLIYKIRKTLKAIIKSLR